MLEAQGRRRQETMRVTRQKVGLEWHAEMERLKEQQEQRYGDGGQYGINTS